MINEGLSAFKDKHVLLLQGPLGPFFRRLADDLERAGAHVSKINFNGGDWLFSPPGAIAFRGRMEKWPAFFEQVLLEKAIDTVLLFGDCRPIHVSAHATASRLGLEIGVFEEGYVRPDYVTLERSGVNGHSQMPRTPEFYLDEAHAEVAPTVQVGNTYWPAVFWAALYYIASALLWPLFRHYRHHRPLSLLEAWPWTRSIWRKFKYALTERGVQANLAGALSERYFLVPLQVHNDAQIRVHSGFESVEAFIESILPSFARYAPVDTVLVIKHHPMDRGYHDHTRLIGRLVRQHSLGRRVRYIHDQHLPTLLEHARGVVLINSTVGLSALHHGTPLKVCGTAIYNLDKLTYQGTLDQFWANAHLSLVNRELFERFRSYLIRHTQLNGSFYQRLAIRGSSAGMAWTTTPAQAKMRGRQTHGHRRAA